MPRYRVEVPQGTVIKFDGQIRFGRGYMEITTETEHGTIRRRFRHSRRTLREILGRKW